MIDVKSDRYMEDKEHVMYLIQNIISIKWKLLEEKIVLDEFYREIKERRYGRQPLKDISTFF